MTDEKDSSPIEKNTATTDEQAVLDFFLGLFISQLGFSEEEDPPRSEIRCLDPDASGADHTYELRVKEKKFKTRRMAMGPLGENSGSKSKCYKVIYDDILVVKIPPETLTDFDEYVHCIHAERRIADRLMPDIECIAPSISALLRKIPRFGGVSKFSPEIIEKRLTAMLKKSPWLQDYLKMGDAFVFFMNLSKHSFLGHVVDNIHNIQARMHEEIFSQFDILWNLMAFEGVYGSEHSSIFFNINEIYTDFEEKVNALIRRNGGNMSAYIYKRKEWFLLYLAEKKINVLEGNLPREFYKGLHDLFRTISQEKNAEIGQYRTMIRDYVQDKMFNQNKIRFKQMIVEILELLYWLKKKGVAVRDLKPDNIFVVGDAFLQYGGDFSLGLIDFETAVIFDVAKNQRIKQPLMAGTPSYATPSHMVTNRILTETLKDLPRVLALQDWHAGMAMIFHVITGERLFEKSRRFVGETWRRVRNAPARKISHAEAFIEVSRLFWQSAAAEFREKVEHRKPTLKAIEIAITEKIREMLMVEVSREKTIIEGKVRRLISSQDLFKSSKSHEDLIRSTGKTINRCRKNWENGVDVPEAPLEIRSGIIQLLKKLEVLKAESEHRSGIIRLLERDMPIITAYDLLIFMFNVVVHSMYREEWGRLSGGRSKPDSGKSATRREGHEETISYEGTITREETISYEKTLSYDNTIDHKEETL